MFKNFGDSIVDYVDGTATDEFEAATYHKANSVSFYTTLLGVALAGAILAWVLPGREALWSVAALIVPLLGDVAGAQWLRNYVASPIFRLRDMPRVVLVIYFALYAIWLAGLLVTGGFDPSGGFDSAGATGAIVGAIIGAVVAGVVSQRISKRRRQRDQARLDAEAED